MRAEEGPSREEKGDFRELLRYTVPGYLGGLLLGIVLDRFGLQRSGIGQWLVRTLAGEGESVLEGVFALRRRLARAPESMAEAYGWGKLAGMAVPWAVDWISRRLGVEIAGVQGFYVPYLYALSDQIGANVSGLAYLRRREGAWVPAARCYLRDPVMVTSLGVILLVPVALLLVRVAGFSPTTQVRAALETIAANACWVPPLVGWFAEHRRARRSG